MASVWLVHGLYSALLGGRAAVGLFDVAIAWWILSGRAPLRCAATQTLVLLSLNGVELTSTPPLSLSPAGLLPLNAVFLTFAWIAAGSRWPFALRDHLRRHPLRIAASRVRPRRR